MVFNSIKFVQCIPITQHVYQLHAYSSINMMVGETYLKQLLANIFKTEMEAFELKVNAYMQEKDTTSRGGGQRDQI